MRRTREKHGLEASGRKEMKEGYTDGNVDSVFCAERKSASVVLVEVLVGEEYGIGACVGEGWLRRRIVA